MPLDASFELQIEQRRMHVAQRYIGGPHDVVEFDRRRAERQQDAVFGRALMGLDGGCQYR